MLVTSVDSENNLFRVEHAVSVELADLVTATDWMSLPWQRQEGQENWARRRVTDTAIPWIDQWHSELNDQWSAIEQQVGRKLNPYSGTAWWVDEPGFTCSMHTDGHLPNAMQLYWIMPSDQYGTGFYHFKNTNSLKHQFDSVPNSGYIMLNHLDPDGSQPLQWHGMFNPVPADAYRLSSYFYFYK
ncbi:MAG: hypothetical protein EBU08_23925 [Micrococcales bacterium]|nr:hypothetical protein [Micrococcales bacterium]